MGWKLFGHETSPAQLPAELRSILAQMQRERVAFETLTTGARESAQQLTQLSQPIADAQKVVTELQGRVKALERLVPVLATLDEQTEAVSRTQRRTETQVDHTAEELKQLRGDIEQLRASFDAALALKGDLTSLLDSAGGLKSLRADADALVGQVRDLSTTFDRARQRQDELNRAGEAAATRLQAFEQRQQQVQGGIATAQTRVSGLEQAVAHLGQAAADAADTKRQLTTLSSLADYVTQKVAVLEQQRDVVDRAIGQATQLDDVMRDIDAKIRKHEENAKSLGALETRVAELRTVHGDLLARSREVSMRHDQIAQADQELHGRLNGLRDEVSRAVKRFELENQGLDAVGQRILDLRGGLTDVEARCRSLDEATRSIGDVRSQADGLVTQLGGLSETVAHLEAHSERFGAVQAEGERLGQTVAEMTQRVARLEKAQPTVDAALRDFSSLKGTHEEVKEALERMRVAEGEIARVREAQAGTKTWLGEVTTSVESLRGELAEVEEIRPTVESVRADADRLSQAMAQIEARRQLADQVNAKLSELTTLTEQLDERSGGLLARMDATDEKFQAVVAHAAESARIEKLVPTVVGNVERAERRMTQVDAAVTALETRAQSLEGLAEQTRALGQELQLRQASLDSATEHLERASQLRAEAASIAQQLEERAGQLSSALTGATERTTTLTATLDDLESRAGNLRFVQKRMAQFEERLAKWNATEEQLMRALEQAAQRQATVDALRADLYRLFEVAEHTVDHVRSIAGAKDQVTETRAMLENVLELVGHAHDTANGLDHRRRQIEQAEERLARVEALLAGIGSSVETLHGQKAFLEQVMEKAGTLEFYAKQAENLISLLREHGVTERPQGGGATPRVVKSA
jgi:DNA repair exonuclease SbcCD ATPase subunit